MIPVVDFTGDGSTGRGSGGIGRELRRRREERADLQAWEKQMAWLLGEQNNGEAGHFTIPRQEVASSPTSDLP